MLPEGTQITQIVYERLFNLGNYENEKLSVTIYLYEAGEVGDPSAAFNEARQLVEAQHATFEQARKAAQEQEYQARLARAEAERLKWEQRRTTELPNDEENEAL